MISEMIDNLISDNQLKKYKELIKKNNSKISNKNLKNKISLVLPVKNEEKNIPFIVENKYLDLVDEIIVIDGNSDDNTIKVVEELMPKANIFLQKSVGKGAAMMEAMKYTDSDYLIFIDGDASMDLRELPAFILKIEENYDMIKGTRFAYGGGSSDLSPIRMFGNLLFTVITNLLYRQSFTDLCYGYVAIKRNMLRKISIKENGFGIETELAIKVAKSGGKIVEVGSFEAKRRYRKSNLRTIMDGWVILKTIIKNKIIP